jgi:hypothetical protein
LSSLPCLSPSLAKFPLLDGKGPQKVTIGFYADDSTQE